VILKLSHLMSYMLYESNEARVSLEKEVNYLQNYGLKNCGSDSG
jgi:hypothetical protein